MLEIPLYKLHYLDRIEQQPLSDTELSRLYQDYDNDEVAAIIHSLEWAAQNPSYPFSSLVPGIQFTQQEICEYIVSLLRQLKMYRPKDTGN